MGRPQLTETRNQAAKARLVEAARHICIQDGESGLSLRKVANVAGLSHTYIYRHFSDKEALISAVRKDCVDDLYAYILQRDEPSQCPVSRIKMTLTSMHQYATENAHMYKFMFSLDQSPLQKDPHIDAARHNLFGFALDLSREAHEEGAIKTDYVTFTHLLWAMFHGLISLDATHNFNLGKTLDQLIEATWDVFFESGVNYE